MLEFIAAVVVGLVILVWSADRFVIGAAATARRLGMSPLLVGLTIVSIGTSAPEIFVSANAAFAGNGNLAIGNAIGSNIANIALVLGITALISPLPIQKKMLSKELPILLLITVIAGFCISDLYIDMIDGIILLLCLVVTLFLLFVDTKDIDEPMIDAEEAEVIEHTSMKSAILNLGIGLVALMISSKMLVWGASNIATSLGVSDLVVGLTIVAIGTSLPELAASIASALKGHHDIAIGNVVGSNIFNLLAVLPIPGLIDPGAIGASAFNRDYVIMLGLTVLLIAFILIFRNKGRVGRTAGGIFTLSYVSYMSLLYIQNS